MSRIKRPAILCVFFWDQVLHKVSEGIYDKHRSIEPEGPSKTNTATAACKFIEKRAKDLMSAREK